VSTEELHARGSLVVTVEVHHLATCPQPSLLPSVSPARTRPSLYPNEELHVHCSLVVIVERRQLARLAPRAFLLTGRCVCLAASLHAPLGITRRGQRCGLLVVTVKRRQLRVRGAFLDSHRLRSLQECRFQGAQHSLWLNGGDACLVGPAYAPLTLARRGQHCGLVVTVEGRQLRGVPVATDKHQR
jgi:hypothetical protein